MIVVLGLAAAVCYGLSDFVGGFTSRKLSAVTVLLYSYPVGAALMAAMLPLFSGELTARALLYGFLGGVAGLVGVVLLYSLMTVAPMNVVSPVTAVLAAAVPVIFGVLVGERPHTLSWLGMALGLIGVVLVSRTSEENPHGRIPARVIVLALIAGVGFGAYFIFLDAAGSDSGIWTLVISRVVQALLVVPLAARGRGFVTVPRRLLGLLLVVGACDSTANLLFLLAAHSGLLSLASVLTSLYPAVTVLLAMGLLHEHASRTQRGGLVLAGAAIVLITL